jgi:dolichyl-phosphate-mannose--protein O-mannosyl transferase
MVDFESHNEAIGCIVDVDCICCIYLCCITRWNINTTINTTINTIINNIIITFTFTFIITFIIIIIIINFSIGKRSETFAQFGSDTERMGCDSQSETRRI